MRKASAKATLEHFMYWLDTYQETIDAVLQCPAKQFDKEQKTELVEALAVRICTLWSILVEDLLIDCLNRNSERYADFMNVPRLPKHIPRLQCEFMLNGIGYFDVKSVEDIQKKAKDILLDINNPFNHITNADKKKINELFTMRNYLAHYSRQSDRKLFNIYKDTYRMKKFSEPGNFLSAIGTKLGKPRFHDYIEAMRSAGMDMSASLKIKLP